MNLSNLELKPPSLENDTMVNLMAGIPHPTLEKWEVWACAFGFVTIINLSSVMGIIFFPLMKKPIYTKVMRTMIGLAIGSLSGSALFHLIPAAFRLDSIEKEEGGGPHYVNIAFIVWLAAWIVMILECAIKIGVKMRAPNKTSRTLAETELMNANDQENKPLETINCSLSLPHANGALKATEAQLNDGETEVHSIHSSKSREQLAVHRSTLSLSRTMTELQSEDAQRQPNQIKTVAWIVIIGDSLHNFIDGVSIGTSFNKSFRTGSIISMAIMCEEFPHELGDFAILITSGMSVKKALCFNFLSALTCYLGMALGIVLGEIEWDCYIFAFAAGIFLYVALGDMVPEVTSLIEEVSEISPRRAIYVLINHNLGILAGVVILYSLALYQPA